MNNEAIYNNILSIISSMQNNVEEKNKIILKIIETASQPSNADGYFLFKITPENYIILDHANIQSINLNISGSICDKIYPPTSMSDIKNKPLKSAVEICATTKEVINSPNIYNETDIDISFFQDFDLTNDYASVSLLSFPIFDNEKNVISIIQFINATEQSGKINTFTESIQKETIAISQLISFLAEKWHHQTLYNKFLESFVSTLSKIITSKNHHEASHNKHVSFIAQRLAISIISSSEKLFPNFEMTDTEWNILTLTSWLYDCGKIIIPDYILNKTSRLETVYNRIHEIRQRFEILRRDAHIEYLQKRLNNIADKETLQTEFITKVKKLNEDFEFIGRCNCCADLKKEDLSRLDEIAEQTFTRYFDRTVGIPANEQQGLDKKTASAPEVEHLLQDRYEQILNIYNTGELSNLKTKHGNISSAENKKIQEYKISSADILSNIPFPNEYSDITEIIATYKKILKNNKSTTEYNSKNSIIAKILFLADNFVSLISQKNPSEKNKKLSDVLKIMQKLKNEEKIDPSIYDIFIKNDIYMDYAKEYLNANQIDEINTEEFI